MKRFTVVDPATGGPLVGLVDIGENNASLGYGYPDKGQKDKSDLAVNESSRYVFQTGAGRTHGTVIRKA